MNKNKGFTLIELLVVIAIIGILSAVVLASLSTARDKGKDASVKSQVASMKAQSELFYLKNETYTDLCKTVASESGLKDLLVATAKVSGVLDGAYLNDGSIENPQVYGDPSVTALGAYNYVTCHEKLGDGTETNPDAWAVEAPLSGSTLAKPDMYCADSTGTSKITTGVLAANVVKCGN